jgi:hypothetical protein
MKNIIWKKEEKAEWVLYRKTPEQFITRVRKYNGRYEIPSAWFGPTKKYNLKSKKTLSAAKAACEKWLADFIKSLS